MSRRAVILIGVLVIVTLGTLAAGTIMRTSSATTALVRTSDMTMRMRSDALSGVRALVVRLGEQREAMLRGVTPDIEASIVLFERGDRQVVLRVLPIAGRLVTPESGKIDLNRATKQMLAGLESVDEVLAGRIVARAQERPFRDPWDLLEIDGIGVEALSGEQSDAGSTGEGEAGGGEAVGLLGSVTVFGADPNVMIGLDEQLESHFGTRRVNLNAEWSEEIREPIAEVWGDDVAGAVRRILTSGVRFDTDSRLVRYLIETFASGADTIASVLDGFTTSPAPYLYGRLDLNSIRGEVLAVVLGFDADSADRAIGVRSGLTDEERMTIAWLLDREILDDDSFILASDVLCARCMQWRVRFVVSEVQVEDEVDAEGFAPPPDVSADAGRSERRELMFEVVLDFAAPRPRVAQLIDLSDLRISRIVLDGLAEAADEPAPRWIARESLDLAFGDVVDEPISTDPLEDMGTEQPEEDRPFSTDRDDRIGRWNTRR